MPDPIDLRTPIATAPGVGARRGRLFEKLGIRTVADLVKHLPARYEFQAGQAPIAELATDAIGSALGMVTACRWVPGRGRGKGRFVTTLTDDSGELNLVWFNAPYLRKKIGVGAKLLVTGKVGDFQGTPQMANPKFQVLDDDGDGPPAEGLLAERYRPVYRSTEGLTTEQIDRAVHRVLPEVADQIEDHLSDAYRSERALPALADAYRLIHEPQDPEAVGTARRRLAYDELLLLQLGFAIKRYQNEHDRVAPALHHSDAIDEHIRGRLPFELTGAQNRVVAEIARDLQKTRPMNRLLQGDVGSGKTVVALYAMLMAVASERQAALMAPTEILAEQHAMSLGRMLRDSGVRVALLTGSLTKAERTAMLHRIERSEIDLVIGTQALLSGTVRFADLAVVVVDEQHRFGVAQRASIRAKVDDPASVPHTLVMTATPIPRTLSLSVFGDLDVSVINQLPPGRQPITTRVVHPDKSVEVYGYIAERVAQGEQAYVVLPAIDDSTSGLKAVRSHASMLGSRYFPDRQVATVHGQLKQVTRERIMHRFRSGKIDVLVATTVIEVGVDVPNASIMVVEHAERFGLAQLHQLRGRVGRGERKSLCVFISDPTTDDALQRMNAIGRTTDGFEIAEADLEIRGIGEFFGTRQSGLPPLKVANLRRHLDLLQMARRDAQAIVDADPALASPEHGLLRKRLIKAYGPALGLADVA